MAFGAIFAFLAAASAWNESPQDRTYGMFALLFGVAAVFGYIYLVDGARCALGYGALLLGATLFCTSSRRPAADSRGFRASLAG